MFSSGQSLAPYVASPMNVVKKMLEIAKVKPDDIVYDLGSGDGRIVIMAAHDFGARGIGVDINPNMVKEARGKVEEAKVGDRVKIIQGHILEADLKPATVVTMYLTTGANEKVRPKLEAELKPGARIVTHDFSIPKWESVEELKFRDDYRVHTIYLYVWSPKK